MNTEIKELLREILVENGLTPILRDKILSHMVAIPNFPVRNRDQVVDLSQSDFIEIAAAVMAKQKIRAIKKLRLITGWGLKDCKDAVENPENFTPPVESWY